MRLTLALTMAFMERVMDEVESWEREESRGERQKSISFLRLVDRTGVWEGFEGVGAEGEGGVQERVESRRIGFVTGVNWKEHVWFGRLTRDTASRIDISVFMSKWRYEGGKGREGRDRGM